MDFSDWVRDREPRFILSTQSPVDSDIGWRWRVRLPCEALVRVGIAGYRRATCRQPG
jgi:hypothetical protein